MLDWFMWVHMLLHAKYIASVVCLLPTDRDLIVTV